MPAQLSLAEVRNKILNENLSLPQIESYVRSLLPNHDQGLMTVLGQALWNTRNDREFKPEFDAQWRSLTQRLRSAYELVDDLEQEHEVDREQRENSFAKLRQSNMLREGEVRIKVEKDLNDQLRERERIQEQLARDAGVVGRQGLTRGASIPLRQDVPVVTKGELQDALAGTGRMVADTGRVAAQDARDAAESKIFAARIAGAAAAKAGKGFWSGLKAGGRGLKAAGGAVGDAMNTPINVSADNVVLWIFFLLTLGIHAMLASFGMQLQWFIYVGGAILLAAVWWAFRGFSSAEFKLGFIVSIIAGIPYLLASLAYTFLSNPDYINSVVFLALIIPIWPIFLIAKLANSNKLAYGIFWIYRVALVILVLVMVVWPILGSALGALPPIGDRVDVGGATVGFWDLLTERWDRVTNRVSTIGQYYTNPDYYTGRVDENQGKPLGVTIGDLRPVDPEVANDSQMILFANVETKSFIGEQVQIIPACVIERTDAPPVASVDPNVLEVVYGTTGSFECTFEPPEGDWRRGVYSIKASATFPFQTWGYLPYTFVDEELARNLARQGLEVRRELGIDQDPDAVYTSGPITLGMGGTDQPILVRREDEGNNYLAPGSRIGVTLDSGWQDGKITAVHEIHLKVPESFILTSCDREISRTEADQNAPGYTSYVFENPLDTSVSIDYTTITCKLGIASAEDAANLVAAGDKAERSFVAVAMYDYTTEEKTSVRVR